MLCFFGLPLAADPVITVYHDLSAWTVAATNLSNASIETSSFQDNGQPTSPDASVHDWGYYGPDSPLANWDANEGVVRAGTNHNDTPYIVFAEPVYGVGAEFANYGALGIDLGNIAGLPIKLDPACTDPGNLFCGGPGFFGFISTVPFSAIYFESTIGTGQGFNLSNLVFAPAAPEPSTISLVMAAFAVLGVCVRTRRTAYGRAVDRKPEDSAR